MVEGEGIPIAHLAEVGIGHESNAVDAIRWELLLGVMVVETEGDGLATLLVAHHGQAHHIFASGREILGSGTAAALIATEGTHLKRARGLSYAVDVDDATHRQIVLSTCDGRPMVGIRGLCEVGHQVHILHWGKAVGGTG